MARPVSRQEFKDFILRKASGGVNEINVTDEQIEDRIDEALSFWADYHYDGSQHVYLKHQLTQTDIDNGYIDIPENILGVSKIFNIKQTSSSGSGIFNAQYQFVLTNIDDLTSYNISNYYMQMSQLSLLEDILMGEPFIRYNRHMNRLYIDMAKENLVVGEYVVVDAYNVIDGDVYTDIWNDRWLQRYAEALVSEQWGRNLTKFEGMQLVGGVTFNGQQILSDAREAKEKLEEEMIQGLQPLVYNIWG